MEIKIWDQFPDIKIKREHVFAVLDCHEDSDVYSEVVREYENMERWLYEHVRPAMLTAWEPLDCLEQKQDGPLKFLPESFSGCGVLYYVMTLGHNAQNYVSELFEEGEYLAGMLLNAMADEFLFTAEDAILPQVKKFCMELGVGIENRMEAPKDIPMEFHRYIFQQCQLNKNLGMELSEGYMFDPVKTSCVVFELSKDTSVFNGCHDCTHCPSFGNCSHKNHTVML